MGERLNNSPKDFNTIVKNLVDKDTADNTKRYLFGLKPQVSVEYAVNVIEFVGEKSADDEQMNRWKILAAESLFALNVESWRELDPTSFKAFKRRVIDKYKANISPSPDLYNITLYWMQQHNFTKGGPFADLLLTSSYTKERITEIKRTYDRLLRGDFSDEQHVKEWYPVTYIELSHNAVPPEHIAQTIVEVLEALASSHEHPFDESSFIKHENGLQLISPKMYQYLRLYPAFQEAQKTWIRVLGNNGKPQDQEIIKAYTQYKLIRMGLNSNTKLSEVDEGVFHSFYIYVQSQHMFGNEEDIGWFYNPETGEVEEYFSQDVLIKLYEEITKQPKKRSRR